MKRILSLMLVSIMLLTMLISCKDEKDTDTNTDTDSQAIDTETSDTGTDTNTDTSTDTNPDNKDEVKTNNVTALETDTIGDYYTKVNYYELSEPNVLPDKRAYNEAYFKMFNSLDELKKYADTKVTESILRDNYVVLIESVFTIGGSEYEDLIGYYDFKYENGKYSISKDYSYSTGNKHMLEMDAKYDYHLDYIIVPKSEIEYTDNVHKIEVSRIQRNKETFFYARPSDKTPLLTEPTSFIVNREIAEQMGLRVSSYGSGNGYNGEVLILYMPDQIMSNLAITECEIENGNLYITIEKYDETAEDVIIPIGPNDAIFYEIYCDTSKLSEEYKVFATVNYTYLPNIARKEYAPVNVHMSERAEDNSYYSVIRKWESNAENKYNFPNELGSYFMLINSYEEMEEYFSTNQIDASAFENNYLMILYNHHEGTYYGSKEIGYRNLTYENGEYKIIKDFYQELGERDYPELVQEFKIYRFLLIPKGEIEYVSGVQSIIVNSHKINQLELNLLQTGESNSLPSVNSGYLVNKDSQLIKDFGLSEAQYYLGKNQSVLLYLCDVPEKEFILTGSEIKNGNLYLTFTVFDHIEKDYFTKEKKFYNVKTEVSELSDSFEIYITFEHIAIPFTEI